MVANGSGGPAGHGAGATSPLERTILLQLLENLPGTSALGLDNPCNLHTSLGVVLVSENPIYAVTTPPMV